MIRNFRSGMICDYRFFLQSFRSRIRRVVVVDAIINLGRGISV